MKDANGLSLGLLWNGIFNKNKLETCPNDFMAEWNESNQTSTLQLKEGKAVNAIYVVDSKGIDAQTGKEIFITQNGTETINGRRLTWFIKEIRLPSWQVVLVYWEV